MQNFKELYQISRIATEQNHFSLTKELCEYKKPFDFELFKNHLHYVQRDMGQYLEVKEPL